jgi:alanine racemase
LSDSPSTRPAWVEIDLDQLRRNFAIINKDKPARLAALVVVKDQAYGHGAFQVACAAESAGSRYLAVATLDEALELRGRGIKTPIMIFGERTKEELQYCLLHNLTCFVNAPTQIQEYSKMVAKQGVTANVHLEVDSGLSRYGVRWTKAAPIIGLLARDNCLRLEGIMSHFAMSDELDKTFANEQLRRFNEVVHWMGQNAVQVRYRHMCNSGGYLDLPQAHFDMVRIGILPLGVYPSQVCRRIPGLKPVMSVKARVAAVRTLQTGDSVGYGMRYRAGGRRTIAVLPVGYGDGYPRVRNSGAVLIHGKRAPVVGGNAMDAMMVDVSGIPEIRIWDEVTLMGTQGDDNIDAHEIAGIKGSVSYDILAGWRARLPRIYKDQ